MKSAQTRRSHICRLAAAAIGWLLPGVGRAQQRRPTDPLVLGVEAQLKASGLADHLVRAIANDTGLPIRLQSGEGPTLVAACERGELDVIITQAPQAEELMERRGFVHDRHLVAIGEYVIAGPGGRKGRKLLGDPAGLRGMKDAAAAFARIAEVGNQGGCIFVANPADSVAQQAEALLWKAAGPQPAGDWLRRAAPGPSSAAAMARELGAYVLAEKGVLAASARELEIFVQGDERLAAPYHVMRSFRVNHPAGRMLVTWLDGPRGRAAILRFGSSYALPGPQS